jgi:hypothetical protein
LPAAGLPRNPCTTNRFSGDEDAQAVHIAAPAGAVA